MRKVVTAAMVAIAMVASAVTPALAQLTPPNNPVPPAIVTRGSPTLTPLGWYAAGSIVCAAVSPMIGTAILGRELTIGEVYHTTLDCLLGPPGWLLADALFPPTATGPTQPVTSPRSPRRQVRARNINIPPPGETRFVPNEVLLEFSAGMSTQTRSALATRLQLTQLETQTFALTGRTIERWRIDGTRSVRDRLRLVARNFPGVSAGQADMIYLVAQAQPAPKQDAPSDAAAAQYVVRKLRLLEAHRINSGDDVTVAVIDSKIDADHPDLAGLIAGEYDAVGAPAPAHSHGTAMAGAIAAHRKLLGVAPRVRLLAVRTFSALPSVSSKRSIRRLKNARKRSDVAAGVIDALAAVSRLPGSREAQSEGRIDAIRRFMPCCRPVC